MLLAFSDSGNLSPLLRLATLTASSQNDDASSPTHSGLHEASAWTALTSDAAPWIEADFGAVYVIEKVAIKGRATTGEYVSAFTLSYALDSGAMRPVNGSDDRETVFSGNVDDVTIVYNDIVPSVSASRLRLHPLTHVGAVSLNWEVFSNDLTCHFYVESAGASDTVSDRGCESRCCVIVSNQTIECERQGLLIVAVDPLTCRIKVL